MTKVYILWHSRPMEGDETDEKLIGVYGSEVAAEAARVRKLGYPGFRDYPDAFSIDPYELDRDAWSEGFISWDEAAGKATDDV